MKKCPKCKAELAEEARFCLYCMSSFEEKQNIESSEKNDRWWLYLIIAVLALACVVTSVFLLYPKNNSTGAQNSASFFSSDTTSISKIESQAGGTSTQSSDKSDSSNVKSESSTFNAPTSNENSSNTPPNSSANNTADKSSSATSESSSDFTEVPKIEYIYRDAKYGDDYAVFTNLENCVVITGVKTASPNGRYEIPETIDGKRVLSIMPGAFCDVQIRDTVKSVIVPSTVITIWNHAFSSCYNLTDIYFCGSSIYTDQNAFAASEKRSGTLIIHCSATCNDRDFRYYKNSASAYDAEYAEWNG